jgi:hypothetical protein
MKYTSEDGVKQALGINSWRNLSRENVVRFASMMPDMDKELAVKIIEQFPAFTKFGLDALRSMERVQETALNFNERSQKRVHDAYQDVRDAIKGELDKDLTPEERRNLIDTMMESAAKESEKDSENKRLIGDVVKTAAVVTVGVLLAAVVILGASVSSDQSEEESAPEA